MNKLRRMRFLLLTPIVFLTACGGGTVPITVRSNWYRNTALGDDIANTYERLEYDVSSSADPDSPQNGFSAEYGGTYVMELRNDMVKVQGGERAGYVLTTELNLKVKFTLNGQSTEEKENYVRTRAEFLPAGERLKPLRSSRENLSDTPNAQPASLQECSYRYHYSFDMEYDYSDEAKATSTYRNLVPGDDGNLPAPETKEYDVEGDDAYFDNEEILFALRGVTPATSVSFRSVNNVLGLVQTVVMQSVGSVEEIVSFEMDGETVSATIPAYEIEIGYQGTSSGQPQTLVYAKLGEDATRNTYRNVLLRMKEPLLQSLGSLNYTLSKATFTVK